MRRRSRKILCTVAALESLEGRVLLTTPHVIYLDFDGHTTSGTDFDRGYNRGQPIVSPAFTSDVALIERIRERVAEDFAPFAVTVTTVDPGIEALRRSGPEDTHWGVRVVLTRDQSWLQDDVGYAVGGIGLTGSFNWSTDTPVFVFNAGEIAAAETVSHEVGHALGLGHSGTGDLTDGGLALANYTPYYRGHGSGATGWAPIMGSGFSKSLSQWNQGGYPRAHAVQDQLQIITTQNGFGYRPDDHGDALETATHLASVAATGLISTRQDVDVFALDLVAGTLSIDVSPASRGANLDVLAELLDASGAVIASANPVDALGASLMVSLPAGRYYLRIDGVGKAAVGTDYGYSDYGSLGQYAIAGGFTPDPDAVWCEFQPPELAPPATHEVDPTAAESVCADDLAARRGRSFAALVRVAARLAELNPQRSGLSR